MSRLIALFFLILSGTNMAQAGTLASDAVLQKIVRNSGDLARISSLNAKERLSVSMFAHWIQDETNLGTVKTSEKSLSLACNTGGFSLIGGYYGGHCVAIQSRNEGNGKVSITLQLMRSKALRFGADAGFRVGGGRGTGTHNNTSLGTFTIHGLNQTNEIPGVYIRGATSASLMAGATVTWGMLKLSSSSYTSGLSGAYLDAQIQGASFEVGAIYGEANLITAQGKPVEIAIQL